MNKQSALKISKTFYKKHKLYHLSYINGRYSPGRVIGHRGVGVMLNDMLTSVGVRSL